jgi:5-methylcytosine-specific restriction endonuclease McrA
MPSRLCIACPNPAMAGRSRCSRCAKGYGPQGPRHHDSVHARLARQVVARAGGAIGGICALCGQRGTPPDPLEGGHIIPASQGGQNVASNYRAEHRSHNRSQGARLARK